MAIGQRAHRRRGRVIGALAVLVMALAATSCGGDTSPDGGSTAPPVPSTPETGHGEPDGDALREELLAMSAQDQAERTGQSPLNGDRERAERLGEMIDAFGWPGADLVGEDGASAAWLIAQHADFDVTFQEQALDLMRPAVGAGNADASELAYLDDRVAVNRDQPQTYGTQIGGCVDGKAEAGLIADEEGVDERRASVGLDPLADYLAEFDEICQDES